MAGGGVVVSGGCEEVGGGKVLVVGAGEEVLLVFLAVLSSDGSSPGMLLGVLPLGVLSLGTMTTLKTSATTTRLPKIKMPTRARDFLLTAPARTLSLKSSEMPSAARACLPCLQHGRGYLPTFSRPPATGFPAPVLLGYPRCVPD